MRTSRRIRIAGLLALIGSLQLTGHGQSVSVTSELGTRLHEKFDVVALQRGVALVPLQTTSTVSAVQIVDGVITVDGRVLTGQELRTALGPDADLVLQASYLDVERQRALADDPAATSATGRPSLPETNTVPERGRVSRGDRVQFGATVTVGADERVQGDVVAVGGSVTIDGEVTGDVVAIGGPVSLGPSAVIRGDLNVVGGSLTRDPGAAVFGETNEVGTGMMGGFGRGQRPSRMFWSFWPALGGLGATLFRLAVLILVGSIVLVFGGSQLDRIAERLSTSPVQSGLVGLLAEILTIPAGILVAVVLAVSIIGIPLLALMPFVVILVMLVMLVGFVALARQLGRHFMARLGWPQRNDYVALALGTLAVGGLTAIAKLAALAGGMLLGAPLMAVGYLVEYVAWTVGFGASLFAIYETQTRFRGRRETGPEVVSAE